MLNSNENIIIVRYTYDFVDYEGKKYCKAYIVIGNDKNSLSAAKRIANTNTYEEVSNEGFTVKVLSAAGASKQGGKVSFWLCLFSKPGVEPFIAGVQSDGLCSLMKYSTFVNGECKEPVLFIRNGGEIEVIHKDMPIYKKLIDELKTKESLKKNKTTKWEVGYRYITTNTDDLYLGKFPDFITVENLGNAYRHLKDPRHLKFIFDMTKKSHIYVNNRYFNKYTNTVKDNTLYNALSYSSYRHANTPSRQKSTNPKIEIDFTSQVNNIVSILEETLTSFNTHPDLCCVTSYYLYLAFSLIEFDKNVTIKLLKIIKDAIKHDLDVYNKEIVGAYHFNYFDVRSQTIYGTVCVNNEIYRVDNYLDLYDVFIKIAENF